MRIAAEAFRRGIELIGSQSAASEVVGKTQQAISARLAAEKVIWAESVLRFEAVTGISRHQLRPDLYPIEQPASTAKAAR